MNKTPSYKFYIDTHQEKIVDIPISEICGFNKPHYTSGARSGYMFTNFLQQLIEKEHLFEYGDVYNIQYCVCDEEFPNITDNIPYANIDIYTEEEFVNWLKNYKYGDEEE